MSARLFVAVDLPADVRAELAAFGQVAAGRVAALRPVAEEALHLTLAFLGDRRSDEVDAARAAVASISVPAPELTLGDVLWLAPRRPHVLAVELSDDSGGLTALHADVVAALGVALPGWAPEHRVFRPHVTVARVRHGQRVRRRDVPAVPRGAFVGQELTLYRSHLGGGPARYEPLTRVALTT